MSGRMFWQILTNQGGGLLGKLKMALEYWEILQNCRKLVRVTGFTGAQWGSDAHQDFWGRERDVLSLEVLMIFAFLFNVSLSCAKDTLIRNKIHKNTRPVGFRSKSLANNFWISGITRNFDLISTKYCRGCFRWGGANLRSPCISMVAEKAHLKIEIKK